MKGGETLKNWKTTLAGLAAGLTIAANGGFTKGALLNGASLFLVSLFAKDADVTGGQRPQ